MPLLRRKPFERIRHPRDLDEDEEVFHCTLTNEIFRDYDAFYERIILCNSLVWSCALTGKANLTYAEAKQSEEAARKQVDGYPKELQTPTLYIASLCQCTSFLDLVEDVYGFLKERYFVGEKVEALLDNGGVDAVITKVFAPVSEGSTPSKSPKAKGAGALDPAKYRYELVSSDKEWSGKKVLEACDVRRPKGRFTRDKHKLFLRFNTETGPKGIIRVKEFSKRKFKLDGVDFSSIFAGPEPNFQQSKKALKVLAMNKDKPLTAEEKEQRRKEMRNKRRKEKRQERKEAQMLAEQQQNTPRKSSSSPLKGSNLKSPKSAKGSPASKKPVKKLTEEEKRELLLRKAREKKEAERLRKLEERQRAREKAREEKRQLEDFYKIWSKPRDDLLCEDLKELPIPCTAQCRIPNDLFGEFVAVLEFLLSFKDLLRVHDFFPKGVTFELLERALCDKEVAGPLSDLLQLLLFNIFQMQEEEEAAVQTTDIEDKVELGVGESKGSVTSEEAIRSATAAANWSQTFQGCSLSKLALDSTTLSEVVRLHLLSSGGRANEANSNWRYQERGGYTLYDDPGLNLRINEPQILHFLSTKSIIELSIGEKLQIVSCLMHQFLMYASVRDVILDRAEKLKKLRVDLRNLQLAEKRRELEEVNRVRLEKQKSKEGEEANDKTTPPPSAEELEAERAKREKENARRRAEFLSKEHKLQEDVTSLEWGVSAMPLGLDRAHRRYWVFQTLPGLFVEHVVDDFLVGPCLEHGTPKQSLVAATEDPMEHVRNLFELKQQQGPRGGSEEASSGSSDKENERSPLSNKQKGAAHSQARNAYNDEEEEGGDRQCARLLSCSGEQDSCPVHSTVLPRVHWAFYNRPEELEALLGALNPRGIRESELRQVLFNQRRQLEANMSRCPSHLLGRPEDEKMEVTGEVTRRSGRQAGSSSSRAHVDANLNFEPGTPVLVIMSTTLRDLILELEEKIHLGGLGTLKVENREAWREAIENGEYDRQCERLTWGGRRHHHSEGILPTDKVLSKIKLEDRVASRPGTPDSVESGPTFQDLGEEGRDPELYRAVRSMASALLQLEQAVESRYLMPPLGINEKERLKRQKMLLAKLKEEDERESGEEEEEEEKKEKDTKPKSTQVERWEVSLMASTSMAQVFVHYSTLDNSIMWAKSALNARCRVCRRKGDGENMLLCDNCDKGHHLYCLKPQLKSVPQGEWFCPSCRPKEPPPPTPRKSRRAFIEESEESEDSEEEDEEEEENDEEEEEGQEEGEASGEEQESGEEAEDEEEEEEEEAEPCSSCGEAGETVRCEECRSCYHPQCATPRLRSVPRTSWTCQDCRETANRHKSAPKRHGAVVMAQKSVSSRRSAREASSKISKAAKRLRSNSWDDTDSSRPGSGGDDASINGNGSREQRARRRPRWLALEADESDSPLSTSLLELLLQDVMAHVEAWPFLRPVQKHEAPDYHHIIKRPMDFGTIKYKLHQMQYRNNSEFLADAMLVFENCEMYNQPNADEYKAGLKLQKFFERKCQEFDLQIEEKDLAAPDAKRPRRLI